jgi:hypothetical protein
VPPLALSCRCALCRAAVAVDPASMYEQWLNDHNNNLGAA